MTAEAFMRVGPWCGLLLMAFVLWWVLPRDGGEQ